MMGDDPTWGDRLNAWQMALWKAKCEALDAFKVRGEDECRLVKARRELKAAEESLRASDAKAQELQARVDQMLRDGEKDGFRP